MRPQPISSRRRNVLADPATGDRCRAMAMFLSRGVHSAFAAIPGEFRQRPGSPSAGLVHLRRQLESRPHFKMLIARAIRSAPMPRDTTASIIISSLAHRLIAETSVGLNAVAVQKASDR